MWYISRNRQQSGPLSWEQLWRQARSGELRPDDLVWTAGMAGWQPAWQIQGLFPAQPAQHSKAQARPRTALARRLIILFIIAIVITGAILLTLQLWPARDPDNHLDELLAENTVQIDTGPAAILGTGTLEPAGGLVTIAGGSLLPDDLLIYVSPDSISQPVILTCSVRPVNGCADATAVFNPTGYLYDFDIGDTFVEMPLLLRLPVKIRTDEYAVAYIYDPESGRIEGLPVISQDDQGLVIATSHFSSITVSVAKKAAVFPDKIPTGFVPGVDDFQFANYGSFAAPRGHCAGQCLAAIWYYRNLRLRDQPGLFNLYDNNGLKDSPKFWQDDTLAYRLASTVQRSLVLDHDKFTQMMNAEDEEIDIKALLSDGGLPENDELEWNALRSAMLTTGRPQYLAVHRKINEKERSGHALIAYRIDGNKIYVADPNYPGDKSRYILYKDKVFQPYSSGEDATAVKNNGEVAYPEITYEGEFALYDEYVIEQKWQEVFNKDMGNEYFPYPMLIAADGVNLNSKTFRFRIEFNSEEGQKLFFKVYSWNDKQILPVAGKEKNPVYDQSAGSYLDYSLELKEGNNRLGFYILDKDDEWAHFQWVDIYVNTLETSVAESTELNTLDYLHQTNCVGVAIRFAGNMKYSDGQSFYSNSHTNVIIPHGADLVWNGTHFSYIQSVPATERASGMDVSIEGEVSADGQSLLRLEADLHFDDHLLSDGGERTSHLTVYNIPLVPEHPLEHYQGQQFKPKFTGFIEGSDAAIHVLETSNKGWNKIYSWEQGLPDFDNTEVKAYVLVVFKAGDITAYDDPTYQGG
jgi:hypothetical protein